MGIIKPKEIDFFDKPVTKSPAKASLLGTDIENIKRRQAGLVSGNGSILTSSLGLNENNLPSLLGA
jgi:hypothetical protein